MFFKNLILHNKYKNYNNFIQIHKNKLCNNILLLKSNNEITNNNLKINSIFNKGQFFYKKESLKLNNLFINNKNIYYNFYHTRPEIKDDNSYGKLHNERENSLIRTILNDQQELKETLAPIFKNVSPNDLIKNEEFQNIIKINYENYSKEDLLENFKKITFYMYDKEDSISHNSFDNIVKNILKNMDKMTDSEICKLLYLLQIWSKKCYRKDRNYYELFMKIDEELIRRLMKGDFYSLSQMLLIIDFWSNLNLIRSSNFCKLALKKLCSRCKQLNSKQFLQAMYYHCKTRSFHPSVQVYDVEYKFEKDIDTLSPNEISVICLAFFKCEKKISSDALCIKLANIFMNNITSLHSVSINGYLKTLRYRFPAQHWDIIYKISNVLAEHLDNLPDNIISHAVLLGTSQNVYNKKLLDKVINKIFKNYKNLRIKEFEKVLFSIMLFNHPAPNKFYDLIINELNSEERKEELKLHPKVLTDIMYYFILLNIYDIKLLKKCLDLEFLHITYGTKLNGYNVPRHILCLDISVDIECPEYDGPKLPAYLREDICKHHAWRKPGELFQENIRKVDDLPLSIQKHLIEILGNEKFIQLSYVLPYYIRPDFLFSLDNNKPIPIPESMTDLVHINPYPPPKIGKWFALMYLPLSQLIKNSTNQWKGTAIAKKRQLKSLGYEIISITAYEWLNENEPSRKIILKQKIDDAIKGTNHN